MANIRRGNAITVRVDEHVAVGTMIRRIASNLGSTTLLLLPILLATAAATQPDGHTPEDDGGYVNNTRGHYNGINDPGNETVHLHDVVGKLNISEIDTSKIDIDLLNNVAARRHRTAKSILHFEFNERRKRCITIVKEIPEWTKGIVYWMYRDQRVQDNWSVLYAQKLAIENKVPLHVVFCIPDTALNSSTLRQHKYSIQGLKEVQSEFQHLNIHFHLLNGTAIDIIPDFVRNHMIGGIIMDFLPLREYKKQNRQISYIFNSILPVIIVDAHNVVPCWSATNKRAKGLAHYKEKIEKNLEEFLTEFPPVIKHPFKSSDLIPQPINWEETDKNLKIDRSVLPVPNLKVGYRESILELENFMKNRLKNYVKDSTNPMKNGLSNLSPWLHFGQISAQRVILEINRFSKKYWFNASFFVDEILTRRELSDNFCYYNPLYYDRVEGAPQWAKRFLKMHRKDRREYLYTRYELEERRTHDDVWNAAQLQMMIEGKMHRFLRMYWAKKILEWTNTPQNALANAIYLNNKYSLDGNDPNSYVGCMWAICSLHDRPWKRGVDRPVFGRIRYINSLWFRRKFDTEAFVKKYIDYTKD